MQIVINIPEEVYESVQLCNESPMRPEYEHVVRYAIKNCITLPTEHGDLIDRDRLKLKCDENKSIHLSQIEDAEILISTTDWREKAKRRGWV